MGIPVANQRPSVSVTGGPAPLSDVIYIVRFRWSATDPDGQVVEYQYAVDPAPGRDTTWTRIATAEVTLQFKATEPQEPLPPPGQRILARDQHTFVLRVRDNEGAYSAPAYRSFSSRTVVPTSTIRTPTPSPLAIPTLPSLTVKWDGADFDGSDGKPVLYRYRLYKAFEIDPTDPVYVASNRVQDFLEDAAMAGFAGWDSTGRDSTTKRFEGLDPGRTYVFAVSAQDEAGAIETRFLTSSNVAQFRPTLDKLGPRLTLFNPYFSYTISGGVKLIPSRIIPLEVPSGTSIPMNWSAQPGSGAQVSGYRWALDMVDQDITDETGRTDDQDLKHWSTWSADETSITIPPLAGSPSGPALHYLYVMARDNLGFATLFTLRLEVIEPTRARDLLVVDDRSGTLAGAIGPYPVEAEEDTFFYAVGGFPDRLVGGTSQPGSFAGISYDTLDYRARLLTGGLGYGVPLSLLGRYKAVAWYTDATSASAGPGTGTIPVGTALRYMNGPGRMNTLAVYLSQGGNVLLFGDGTPSAISNGFFDFQNRLPVPPPFTTANALRAGCFLYDFIHLRSRLTLALQPGELLRGAIPFLPEFRGPATQTDRSHDPRIGAGGDRTALRWPGLPRLSLAAYRGAPTDPSLQFIKGAWNISLPLNGLEGPAGAQSVVLDTLYLLQSRDFLISATGSDGRPNALHYHGSAHGQVVWLGFALYYFEHDQVRTLIDRVMEHFDIPVDAVGAATLRAPGAGRARPIPGDR